MLGAEAVRCSVSLDAQGMEQTVNTLIQLDLATELAQ